jgi:phosphoribosylamine--glycine ligase
LQGDEIGSTVICKGTHYLPFTLTQDHKRAFDGDRGLNTGGMGAFTPLRHCKLSRHVASTSPGCSTRTSC